MNVSFYTNSTGDWSLIGYNESSSDGTYYQTSSNFNSYETKYWWSVNCTDGYNWANETYYFTAIENQPTLFSNINPSNELTDVSISTSTISIIITDFEGDLFNWAITTSPNIGSNSGNSATNGTKSCSISGLDYNTQYYWYVSALDTGSNSWSNATYWFETEEEEPVEEEEEDDTGSGYSGSSSYTPSSDTNIIPSIPTINGPTSGYTDTSYSYTANSTDSNNDQISYKFDWGDETTSEWTDLAASGTEVSLSHSWNSIGVYNVKAIAKDENGGQSSWSEAFIVSITEEPAIPDEPDEIPIIVTIPDNTTVNNSIQFSISQIATLEGINLTYYWDFGDGTNTTEYQPNHKYTLPGTYIVTLKTYNNNGTLINTTTFEIIILEGSNAEIETIENEIIEENNENPLLWILFITFGAIFVIILLLLKKLISTSQKDEESELFYELNKNIDKKVEKIKMFEIGPKNIPGNLPTAKYNHDLVNELLDESIGTPSDIEFNQEQNIKRLRKEIDELILEEKKEE